MRTATPWWLAWAQLTALLLLFVSERTLGPWAGVQTIATGVVVLTIVASIAIRVLAVARTQQGRRRVELTHLLISIGTLIAIVFYLLTTKAGLDLVGAKGWTEAGRGRFVTVMRVLCGLAAAGSIIPMIMIEATLGVARRSRIDLSSHGEDAAVEYRRVREIGLSGLTVALAMGLLMVTCNVARQRNLREDVSYFKTSSPGESTQKIVKSLGEPLKVLLFFPEINEVKDEARAYFKSLADATGAVVIEEHTVNRSAALVKERKVTQDGTVVLVRGEGEAAKSEKIELGTDFEAARRASRTATTKKATLRNLDGAVNAALFQLARDKRKAYQTVGHGEINDPDSVDAATRAMFPEARANVLKSILHGQNYEVKNLGRMDGLATEIPEDATMVLVLGPRTPFLDEELDALDRYVQRGGNLLIALDPKSDAVLGQLEGRLGVRFDRASVLDDKNFVARRGPSWAISNQFSSHASITSLSKAASNEGVLLQDAGSLEDTAFADGGDEASAPKRTYVIRSMPNSWRDVDGDGKFTEGVEKRDRYNVAVAVEGKGSTDAAGEEVAGFRALVFADIDLFVDRPTREGGQVFLETWGGPIPADAIKWVGGEEIFSGEIQNENDKEVEQTEKQDTRWFLLMIVGAPLLVMGLGLIVTTRRRRKIAPSARKAASTSKESP